MTEQKHHSGQQVNLAEFLSDLKVAIDDPYRTLHFESELEKVGLLSKLEEAGILPNLENPNPFHHEYEEEQHDQWWEDHREEGEKFVKDCETREETLRFLLAGAILGSLLGYKMSPRQENS